jgi:hypothetical protein
MMSFSGEREITSLCNATLLNCIAGHGFPTMHYTLLFGMLYVASIG